MWEIDYHGQQTAERLVQSIVIIGFVSGTIYAWYKRSILEALYGWLGGLSLALVITVPPWSWYRRHPLKWIPIPETEEDEGGDGEGERKTREREKAKEVEKRGIKPNNKDTTNEQTDLGKDKSSKAKDATGTDDTVKEVTKLRQRQ